MAWSVSGGVKAPTRSVGIWFTRWPRPWSTAAPTARATSPARSAPSVSAASRSSTSRPSRHPSPTRTRPIWSICNGQIYNAPDLFDELKAKGHTFRTETDTEAIPHLYEEYGASLVEHLNGMFAFAVWDEPRKRLLLARDRAGEKPLYYWSDGQELVFASDLRAFLVHPRIPKALDPVALRRYLTHDYFPAPLSPLQGIRKLPAGHLLIAEDCKVTVKKYWDLADYFVQPDLAARSSADLADELDDLMAQAVRRRSRSDVPFGLFLSGGIDSSAVLSYLAEQQGDGVPVFSIGHTEKNFDEASMAEVTARHFKADFNQLILDESHLADGLRRVGPGLGEPLGDASTIPSHLLALFARKKVKVILSGEGADELFAGYPTYIGNRVAEIYNHIPRPVRNAMVNAALKLCPGFHGQRGSRLPPEPLRRRRRTGPGGAPPHVVRILLAGDAAVGACTAGLSRPWRMTTHSVRRGHSSRVGTSRTVSPSCSTWTSPCTSRTTS